MPLSRPVSVIPGHKPWRQVFSWRGLIANVLFQGYQHQIQGQDDIETINLGDSVKPNISASQPQVSAVAAWPYQVLNFSVFLVWFLFYGPSTHFRSFRARSVNLAILFLGKPPFPAVYQYLVHILSIVTDNFSSWISGRGRIAVEMFSWPSLHERMCRTWGSNSGLLACQANSLSIELPRLVSLCVTYLLVWWEFAQCT